jgi:ATP-dependent DNA helicase MPH1
MSSDGYFDSDELDSAAFEQLDAIEASLLSPRVQPVYHSRPLPKERSLYDLTFDIDEAELQRLDEFIQDTYQGKVQPVAGSSTSTSSGTHQTTLFGEVLSPQPSSTRPRSQVQKSKSTPRNPFGQQAKKTKQWDQTAFAKSGLRGRPKGKGKAKPDDEEEQEEEMIEFEQFPAPFVSSAYPLLRLSLN